MEALLKLFSTLKRLELIQMVYMRCRPLLHVSPDRRPTGPGWLLPKLASVQWVAGVVTALPARSSLPAIAHSPPARCALRLRLRRRPVARPSLTRELAVVCAYTDHVCLG